MADRELRIRPEREGDRGAIRTLLVAAFPRHDEADMIDRLGTRGDITVSLVAETDVGIVGHVALSALVQPARCLALAPLAVTQACRRRGIGATLVRAACARAAADGAAMVFVLGDPTYYGRFGFSTAEAAPYPSVYSGEHFMALHVAGARPAHAAVVYPPAFDRLGV